MRLKTALEKASEIVAGSTTGESILLHGMKRQPSGSVIVSKLEASNAWEARKQTLDPSNDVLGRVHGSPVGNIMVQSMDQVVHDTWNDL